MNRQLIFRIAGPAAAILAWWLALNSGWDEPAAKVLAAAAWMLIWWIAEAVPIGVTSILPMVLFPVFGIADIGDTTAPYGSHYVFLFMGGFLIALGLEKWSLHRRFALTILAAAGGRPRRLIAGFMLATAVLSMWISNTATTLMMLPIAVSVLSKVNSEHHPRFAVALLLGTAYAANLGGIATLIGTPPNVALAGIMQEQYSIELPFFEWMLMASPFSCLMLVCVYWLLTRVLAPVSAMPVKEGLESIRMELNALGPWTQAERRMFLVFGLTGGLWVSRRWIESGLELGLNDTTIAMAAGIALFLMPANRESGSRLLTWGDTKNLPWEILLLFGGGLTLANALKDANVLQEVASSISMLNGLDPMLLLFILTALALLLTEVMSNLALTVVLVPVVAQVAIEWNMNPLLLAIPVTMASSCAFMLPMATPPNAIIFGSNRVSMKQMASVGLVLNVVAAGLAWVWGAYVLPVWLPLL